MVGRSIKCQVPLQPYTLEFIRLTHDTQSLKSNRNEMAFRNSYPIYRWQLCAGSCDKSGNVKFDEGTQKNDITKQTSQDEFRGKFQLGKMMRPFSEYTQEIVQVEGQITVGSME
ncbi:hypothetical protein JTB14_027570 [Gonioctena quinquepunctata]|nr:hypothetical protein JTB14_027570 [Gonioctena quinquepunctata]